MQEREVCVISGDIFENAKKGDKFIGINSLTWEVEGPGQRGGLLCKSPHSEKTEEIFFRDEKIVHSDGWAIEELNESATFKGA